MRLKTKLLLAPCVTVLVALGSGAFYATTSYRQIASNHQADAAGMATLESIANAQDDLITVRAEVFRALALIASMDEAAVKSLRADLARRIQGVKQRIAGLAEQAGKDEDIARLTAEATPLLDTYLARCDKAIDLSGVDPNVGIGAMRAAEDSYFTLEKALHGLSKRNNGLQEQRAEAALNRTMTLTLTLALAMLLASGAALAFAWRVQRRVMGDINRAVELSSAVAQGTLDVQGRSDNADEVGDLLRALGHMADQLRHSLQTVRSATDHIATASQEIAAGNLDLSQRTEQTASSLQQTSSSMERLTGAVRQTAESARSAQQLAGSASAVATRGGDVVAQVVSTMEGINASSHRIGDIIGRIDGIAFQTNILALNAAVEAARAGEQGRGFAVVASEVRALAQRSAEAAREIKALISDSVGRVETGSKLVADAGHTMHEIVASVRRVCNIIGEISAAAEEQSRGIGQVNTAIVALDQMTQQNAALVEQSAAAAESLKTQAGSLTRVLGRFKLGGGEAFAATGRAPEARVVARLVVDQAKAKTSGTAKRETDPGRAALRSPALLAEAATDWETF